MNWPALRNNCCPKCSSPLKIEGLLDARYFCTNQSCDFSIGEVKFDSIMADFYGRSSRKQSPPDENLSELNNLGHNIVAEDFTDSPHKDKS